MPAHPFGTSPQYSRALREVIEEGVHPNQLKMLRAHAKAPGRRRSVVGLAEVVRYKNFGGVNLWYGRLGERVGRKLGLRKPPRGFWMYVLVDWADRTGFREPGTPFVLRQEAFDAAKSAGLLS